MSNKTSNNHKINHKKKKNIYKNKNLIVIPKKQIQQQTKYRINNFNLNTIIIKLFY